MNSRHLNNRYNGRVLALLLGMLVCIAYLPALLGTFQFDDQHTITLNPYLKAGDFSLSDRPLTDLTFYLDYLIHGLNPFWFKLTNLALHLFMTYLVYRLVILFMTRVMTVNSDIALLTAAIFAVHPMNTEAVAYISQRSEILASIGILGAFLLLSGGVSAITWRYLRYWAGFGIFLLALLAKPVAIVLPLLLLIACGSWRRWLRAYWPIILFSATSSVWFLSRFTLDLSPWHYFLTQIYVVVSYLQMLIVPVGQSIDHDMPLLTSLGDMRVLASLLVLLPVIVFIWRQRCQAALYRGYIYFGGLLFFCALLPSSSVIPLIDLMFEHRVYLSSAGFAIVLSSLLVRWTRWPVWLLLVLVLAGATTLRTTVWLNPVLLWSDAVEKAPGKQRPWMSLGQAHAVQGRCGAAYPAFERALAIGGRYTDDSYREMGLCAYRSGDLAEAERYLSEALALNPQEPAALHTLALVHIARGQTLSAVAMLRELTEHYPLYAAPYNTVAVLELMEGRFESALRLVDVALSLNPELVDARFNRALILELMGKEKKGPGVTSRPG